MHTVPRILAGVALAAAVAAGAAAPAQAAWTTPQAIRSDTGGGPVVAAGNRHGSQAFAWAVTTRRTIKRGGITGPQSFVRARIRLPGGRLGAVQTVSGTSDIVGGPQIGVDDGGDVTAVWVQAGAHLSIMVAFKPHGRRFGRPVEIGRSRHFNDARAALAVGPFGDAVVAWNAGPTVQVALRSAAPRCVPQRARACFHTPVALRAGADQAVAIGPLGSAYVVWAAQVRTGAEVHTRLRLAVLRRGGRRIGREHFVSVTGDASEPSLAVAPDGSATIAWRASLPAGGEQNDPAAILAARSTPDALVAAPQTVTAIRGDRPQVRLNAQGEALLAFDELDPAPGNPDGEQVAFAVRPAGAAAFGAPAPISPPGVAARGASLAVDAAGSAYLLYSAGALGVTQVRAPGGVFGAPTTLPAFAGGFLLAAGARITAVSATAGSTFVSDWTS